MPVTFSSKKFQFSNKQQPLPIPKPPFELFPYVKQLSDGKTVRVSVPQPDRLTLIVDLTAAMVGSATVGPEAVAAWVKGAGDYLKTEPFNCHHVGNQYFPGPPPWYKFVDLNLGERASSVRFEFLKAKSGHGPRLRLDLNPRKLGKPGFVQLKKLFDDAAGPFSKGGMLGAARVSRLDIAVDIVGLQTSEVVVTHAKQGKRSFYVGKDGLLETINIHRGMSVSKPSGSVVLRVYDRRRERIDRGKAPPFGSAEITRVEVTRALKQPHNSLQGLMSISDPFGEVSIAYAGDQTAPVALWVQYHALTRTMPVEAVAQLLSLSEATSKAFATAMRAQTNPLIGKGITWEGWKDGVKQSGMDLLLI